MKENPTSRDSNTDQKDLLSSEFAVEIPTQYLIDRFLEDKDLSIGGRIFNQENLKVLKSKSDLASIGSCQQGCYFIFSTLEEFEIPSISVDGYQAYSKYIEKDGEKFRCLYNGKGQHIKERLQLHLFNSHTLTKVLSENHKAKTISGTGALSLETISAQQAKKLEELGKYFPSKHKLKPVQKALHVDSHLKLEDQQFFLNGIDITEEQWAKYKFAVVVIKTNSEFGKILIEEAFATKNKRPPLCRRHG
jgi:hypothetical protein